MFDKILSKILPKSFQNPTKILPKSFQNPPETLPKPTFEERRVQDTSQNPLFGHLGRFFQSFGGPRASQNRAKIIKNRRSTIKNRSQKKACLSTRFFLDCSSFWPPKIEPKIDDFSTIFPKRRFCINPYKTLAVRTKIKVRTCKNHAKSSKNRCRNHDRKKHRKKPLKNRFWPPLWPPKSSQNRSEIEKSCI